MPPEYVPAEKLLVSLGITEPDDIDICAIAQTQGATVVEKPVTGCDARIMGYGEKAVIVVNTESNPRRKRFSAAHELGHWMRDGGKMSLGCNPESQLGSGDGNAETRADRYASDLLMPKFMFVPRANAQPMTFETVSTLADVFKTSLTATSIRLVEHGSYPAMLICTDIRGVRWFCRGPEVPKTLRPVAAGPTTYASDLLRRQASMARTSGQVYSDQWFGSARRHGLHEDSRRITDELVLSLLWCGKTKVRSSKSRRSRSDATTSDRIGETTTEWEAQRTMETKTPWKKNLRQIPDRIMAKVQSLSATDLVAAVVKKVPLSELEAGTYGHLGLQADQSRPAFEAVVVPTREAGRYSGWNLDGREVVRRDLPIRLYRWRVDTARRSPSGAVNLLVTR